MSLIVNEIFYSIQGESSYAGRPCVFIRLTGCNLRCSYCDTQYAYDEGDELDISEILERISTYECPLVEITGGEPLIQKDTPELISSLIERGHEVLLETNGTINMEHVNRRCAKIIDIKCPSSDEHEKCDPGIFTSLSVKDEVKFVIGDRYDYEYAKKQLRLIRNNPSFTNPIHFSPVFGKIEPQVLVKWILEDHLDARINIQLHKIIWGPDVKGV